MPTDPTPSRPGRALPIAAAVEALSLGVLLTNLATAHHPAVAAAVGPVHGTAYLVTILLAWTGSRRESRGGRARWLALIPGIGGLLAVRSGSTAPPDRDRRHHDTGSREQAGPELLG